MGGGAEDFFVEASYMPFTPAARDEDLQADQLCAVIACMHAATASERACGHLCEHDAQYYVCFGVGSF